MQKSTLHTDLVGKELKNARFLYLYSMLSKTWLLTLLLSQIKHSLQKYCKREDCEKVIFDKIGNLHQCLNYPSRLRWNNFKFQKYVLYHQELKTFNIPHYVLLCFKIRNSPLICFSFAISTIIFPLTISPAMYVAVDRLNSKRNALNDDMTYEWSRLIIYRTESSLLCVFVTKFFDENIKHRTKRSEFKARSFIKGSL